MKNWSPWIVKDYYGEIIADIYLDDDIKNEIFTKCIFYMIEIPCK